MASVRTHSSSFADTYKKFRALVGPQLGGNIRMYGTIMRSVSLSTQMSSEPACTDADFSGRCIGYVKRSERLGNEDDDIPPT